MSLKIKRIQAELNRTISEILSNEARDEIMHSITITGSEVAPDLSFAKVYFTSMLELDKEQLEKELEEAAGFIRSEVAKRMDLRNTPKLKFVFDESIEYGNKIEQILNDIKKNEQ